jgi:hypothetical protein
VAVTVRAVFHPVGPLPAAVYWRRRFLVLTLFVSVFGGGGWFAYAATTGTGWPTFTEAAASSPAPAPVGTPALDRVVPSLASVQVPTSATSTASTASAANTRHNAAPTVAGPTPSRAVACTDDLIGLEVRSPGRVAVGAKPTFELRVVNTSRAPCVRALDKGLQERAILDGAGRRLWGSNDCFPETSRDTRTIAPGEVVSLPIIWSGLTSQPACAGARTPLAPGTYLVRGRLDTKKTPDARLVVG